MSIKSRFMRLIRGCPTVDGVDPEFILGPGVDAVDRRKAQLFAVAADFMRASVDSEGLRLSNDEDIARMASRAVFAALELEEALWSGMLLKTVQQAGLGQGTDSESQESEA